jgi:starch phosphorylase
VNEKIPERISRLDELANNLWWSWHDGARELFRQLNYRLWRASGHNPVKQLREMTSEELQAAANDPSFLNKYDSVMSLFDAGIQTADTWFSANYAEALTNPVAYFSMEFAIHNSLPIYAGGLGVLAGDTCKEASDLGLPFVGVGFMYPNGYFHQHISPNGWQEEIYAQLNFDEAPIEPIDPASQGQCGPLIEVSLGNRSVGVGAWRVRLGRVNLYLLCCDVEGNMAQDRHLCDRLYIADREQRIQQEIVLGIGGVRLLRMLGINPSVWHANEGHTAFMTLERIREEVKRGTPFTEAVSKVQATTVFTTHTPVAAGHDIFPVDLMERYFHHYWEELGIDQKTFLELGQAGDASSQGFNMTVLALKLASHRNGVSQLHGTVARKMWHVLWPDVKEGDVPITHITNGVHVPNWIAPEMCHLYQKYLGQDFLDRHDDADMWQRIMDIPNDELWEAHQVLKRKVFSVVLERARSCSIERECTARQILTMGTLLDPEVLTIGFIRRFAEYKRPALLFTDIERLQRILNNQWQPVQIVFAGKSHPADFISKNLLQRVYSLALSYDFHGRIAFVEDYDMHLAHFLAQGIDVWLDNPRRLVEACGTSGMKASLNGVIHLGVLDGWWYEGYNSANGWAIGDSKVPASTIEEDKADAETLYRLLENQIVPLYYKRRRGDVPHDWIRMVKEAIRSTTPAFSSRRMLKEYLQRMYMETAAAASDSQ